MAASVHDIVDTGAGKEESPAERVLAFWQSEPLNSKAGRLGFCFLLCCLCLLPALAGPMMQYAYAHDAFIFIDGGWRVLHGQRPQVDFSTNLGPIMFVYTALGLALAKGGGHALQIAHGLMGVTVALLTFLVCFRRLPQVPAALLCVLIVLMAMAPFNTGEFPLFLTSGMLYNRIGYALIGVILVEALVSPAPHLARKGDLLGGAATGFILAFLLLMKITYFVAGAAAILLLLPCRRQTTARIAGLGAVFVTCALLGMAYLRFDIPALLYEYRLSMSGKQFVPSALVWLFLNALPLTLLLIATAVTAAFVHAGQFRFPWNWWKAAWAVAVAGLAGYMVLVSNHQIMGEPLNAFAGVILASGAGLAGASLDGRVRNAPLRLATAAALLLPGLCLFIPTAAGYSFSLLKSGLHWKGSTPEVPLNAPGLKDMSVREEPFLFDGTGAMISRGYGPYLNDGFDLLRRHSLPTESVMSLDFSNAFSFGLGRPPQRGGATCLQAGVTFSAKHAPPPERLFGDAELVMLPKWFTDDSIPNLVRKLYGPTLRANYKPVGESEYWTLFRRRS